MKYEVSYDMHGTVTVDADSDQDAEEIVRRRLPMVLLGGPHEVKRVRAEGVMPE